MWKITSCLALEEVQDPVGWSGGTTASAKVAEGWRGTTDAADIFMCLITFTSSDEKVRSISWTRRTSTVLMMW